MSMPSQGAHRFGLWLFVTLALLAIVSPQPARAQAVRVTDVEIRGNQRINQESIRSVISTRRGDELSLERVERDRLAILGLGWFRLVTATTQPEGEGVRVVFVLTEYPQVTELQVTGSSIYTTEQLQELMKTKVGQVFNAVNWEQDLNTIQQLYTDKGYRVQLVHNTDVRNAGAPQPDFLERGIIRLEIMELRVGSVKIKWPTREIKDKEGNVIRTEEYHKTKDYVVLRELSQKEGALYNEQKLAEDFRALNNLGFFETINPVREISPDLTVAITWELTERRTGQVSIGAGYSPRQRLIGRAELSDQNFRGRGQGVSISGELGAWAGDGRPSIELRYFEPWLTKDKTSLTVSVYDKLIYRFSRDLVDNQNDVNRYFERRTGGQLSFGRPFKLPITTGIRYDSVRTGDLPRRVDFPRQNGQVIAGNVSRLWNTRDYPNNPTSGSFTRIITEFGHASLDETNSSDKLTSSYFGKFIVDTRKYIPLKKRKATQEPEREQEAQKMPVLALRMMAGHVAGDVPFFEQFFVGGAETLRGYLEDRFWGNTMYLASVEYRRPIMNRIVGVVFVDVGDAFNSGSEFRFTNPRLRTNFRQHDSPRPFASIGFGLRVATPIGPIRLDVGFGEERSRTHFSIGHAF